MSDVVYFDDETKEVPRYLVQALELLNPDHYAIVLESDGSIWHGRVSKSDDGSVWFVGGQRLMQVSYAPFKVWLFPWHVVAIINLADYVDYMKEDVLAEYTKTQEILEYETRMGQDL